MGFAMPHVLDRLMNRPGGAVLASMNDPLNASTWGQALKHPLATAPADHPAASIAAGTDTGATTGTSQVTPSTAATKVYGTSSPMIAGALAGAAGTNQIKKQNLGG